MDQVHYTCLKGPSEPHLVYLVHPLEVDLVHLGVKTTAAGGVGILVCPWKKTAAGVGQDKAPIRVEGQVGVKPYFRLFRLDLFTSYSATGQAGPPGAPEAPGEPR